MDPFAQEEPNRVPRPDVVVGPPLEEYFTRAQLEAAREQGRAAGKAAAKVAFDRRSLLSIARERFDRWLRRL